jgi:hypothetical protein
VTLRRLIAQKAMRQKVVSTLTAAAAVKGAVHCVEGEVSPGESLTVTITLKLTDLLRRGQE